MDLLNFGLEQLNNGSLNNMLQQVGVDDVGSFVSQFRNNANREARRAHDNSGDSSYAGSGDNLNSDDIIQGAMNAYRMFGGGQGSDGAGNRGFFDNINSTYQNARKMHAMYKQFDKNGDGKITVEDIQIYLQEIGLGSVSPYLAKAIFQAVDQNNNGSLDFTDLMALTALINRIYGQYGRVPQ